MLNIYVEAKKKALDKSVDTETKRIYESFILSMNEGIYV